MNDELKKEPEVTTAPTTQEPPESQALRLWKSAAELLKAQEAVLSARVSNRCFAELASYQTEQMPREESRGTVGRLLDHIVARLLRSATPGPSVGRTAQEMHDELVSLEQGIAARRVQMAIDFEDLLRGMHIMRQELWAILRAELPEDQKASPQLWELERVINDVFDQFFIGLASSYLTSQREQIAHHESSLAKWEEVVRSASHIRLKIPCLEEFASTVRLQAEAIARRVLFSDEEIYDIITAVGEVCDNAIEHGRSERGIEVEYAMTKSEFRVEVKDYGPGFDPTGRGEQPPDVFAESGRGIFLMKNLMDTLEIESKPGGGTRIVMAKSRLVS
jgi:serine/threonine-protein kinase RsbW